MPSSIDRAVKAPFDVMLPIELADGGRVASFRSPPDWRTDKTRPSNPDDSAAEPITAEPFLTEEHHRFYGRPWVLGRYYTDKLVDVGVRPSDRVLDLGCGAGRVGVHLIPYLDSGCYFGVDNHLRSLVAFAGYEAFLHQLFPKRPRLLLSSDFEVEAFGTPFNVVLDFFVTAHLPEERLEPTLGRILRACAPAARYITLHPPGLGSNRMGELGFELKDDFWVSYPLLRDAANPRHLADHWHIFVRK